MTLTAGARLNLYEILSPLGRGGMDEVYLAEDTRLQRKLALKLLPEEFSGGASGIWPRLAPSRVEPRERQDEV